MNDNSATAASFIATMIVVYGIVIVGLVVFTIWIYWRIFAKAGFNGALSLLNLVPGVGQLICMVILAFGRWPLEDELDALRRGGLPAGPMPAAGPDASAGHIGHADALGTRRTPSELARLRLRRLSRVWRRRDSRRLRS